MDHLEQLADALQRALCLIKPADVGVSITLSIFPNRDEPVAPAADEAPEALHAAGDAIGLSQGPLETLHCLFFHGPTFDGDLPSKQGRDALVELGYATGADGFNWLTDAGVEAAIKRGFGREKEARAARVSRGEEKWLGGEPIREFPVNLGDRQAAAALLAQGIICGGLQDGELSDLIELAPPLARRICGGLARMPDFQSERLIGFEDLHRWSREGRLTPRVVTGALVEAVLAGIGLAD